MIAIIVTVVIILVVWLTGKKVDESAGMRELKRAAPLVPQWIDQAQRAASRYSLPWQIVLAQIWQESHGDPDAVGSAGEIGLMQLKQIAIDDLVLQGYGRFPGWKVDPPTNIMAGAAYLDLQWDRSGTLADALGKTRADALESYNEGYSEAKKDLGPDEYSVEVIEKAKILGWE